MISELRKTPLSHTLRSVALGSRKNLCINKAVRAGGDAGLDERCLDLQSATKAKRCEFLSKMEAPSRPGGAPVAGDRMRKFGERVLASVRDLEDLVELGKETCVCPYYGSRSVIPQAQVSCFYCSGPFREDAS